jgi:hypothetical protein
MPRTTYFDGWTVDTLQRALPIWVISLARAKERREAMIKGLKAAGAKHLRNGKPKHCSLTSHPVTCPSSWQNTTQARYHQPDCHHAALDLVQV